MAALSSGENPFSLRSPVMRSSSQRYISLVDRAPARCAVSETPVGGRRARQHFRRRTARTTEARRLSKAHTRWRVFNRLRGEGMRVIGSCSGLAQIPFVYVSVDAL